MKKKHWFRLFALLLALALFAAACGDDDGDSAAPDDGDDTAEGDDADDSDDAAVGDDAADEVDTDDGDDMAGDDDADDADDDADDGDDMAEEIATGPGFDGTTINVGVISDLSGPVAIIGKPLTAGGQVYYDYINSQGGVAGQYLIETVEVDHQYNPATAVQVYNQVKDDVVIIGQLLGTPITNAVLESLKEDGLVAAPASLDAFWVREQNLLPIGGPYQIQAINGSDWWINEGGGSVDQVYCSFIQDDPYGEAGQEGIDFAADNLGFTVTEIARYVSGDTDFSAQIQQLQGAGCEVVFLVSTPSITGGALGTAAAGGYAPQWIGISPTWINALAGSALAPYLQANFVIVAEGSTWGDDSVPGMSTLIERLEEFAPDQEPDYYFTFGYLQAHAVVQVLEAAVASGDLSREGIIEAMNSLGTVSFEGLGGDYFYGTPDERVPSTENTIFAVNPEVPNGVEAVVIGYRASFVGDFVFG